MDKVIKIKIDGIEQFKTLTDLLKMSSKTLDEMIAKQEALGQAMEESLSTEEIQAVTEEFNQLNTAITKTEDQLGNISKEAKSTEKSFEGIGVVTSELSGKAGELAGSFSQGNEEAAKLEENIGAMSEAFALVSDNSDTLKEGLGKVFSITKKGTTETDEGLKSNSSNWGILGTWASKAKDIVSEGFTNMKNKAGDFLLSFPLINKAYEGFGQVSEKVSGTVSKGTDFVKDKFKKFNDLFPFLGKSVTLFGNITKLALLGTGIGVFVLALGGLVAYFKSTQEGANKLSKILGGLNGVFQGIIKLLAPIGKLMTEAFENPKQAISDLGTLIVENLTNRIVAFKDIIAAIGEGDFKGMANGLAKVATGVDDVIGKSQKLSEQVKKDFDAGSALADQKIKLNELLLNDNKLTKENLAAREKLRNVIDDASKSDTQRLKASKEIINLGEQEFKRQQDIYKQKLDLAKAEAQANGNLLEDRQKIADLEAELAEKSEEFYGLRSEQIAVQSAIIETAKAAELEGQKQIRDQKTLLIKDVYDQQKKTLENEFADRIKDIENSKATEETKNANKKLAYKSLQRGLSEIDKTRKAEIEGVEKEIRDFQTSLIKNDLERNKKTLEDKRNDDIKAANETIKDKTALANKLKLIQDKFNEDISKLDKDAFQKQRDTANKFQQESFNQRLDEAEGNAEEIIKIKQDALEYSTDQERILLSQQYQQGLIDKEEFEKRKLAIEKRYNEDSKDLDNEAYLIKKENFMKQVDGLSNVVGGLNGVYTAFADKSTKAIEKNIESIDKAIEGFQKQREIAEEELGVTEERLTEVNDRITGLSEVLAESKGGISLQIQEQLEEERKKQRELNKEKAKAKIEIDRLKKAEEAAAKSKVEQEKELAKSAREQAKVNSIATLAQTGLNVAKAFYPDPVSAQTPYGIGLAIRAAAALAFVAQLKGTITTLQGFAEGGIVKSYSGMITGGIPIQRDNGDNVLITAKTGEVILTEQNQEAIGRHTLAKAGVKGFRDGGPVTELRPVTTQDSQALLIEMNNNLAKFASKETYVAFTDLQSEEARFTKQQDRKEVF